MKAIILLTQAIVPEESNVLKRPKLALDPGKLGNSRLQFILGGAVQAQMVARAEAVNGPGALLSTGAVGAMLLWYLAQPGVTRRRCE